MWISREVIIGEHEAVEGIFGHLVEEERAPATIEGGRLLEDEGGHRLDVDHLVKLARRSRTRRCANRPPPPEQ